MSDPMDDLEAILEEVEARPSFDRGRSFTKPCTFCGDVSEPARTLVTLGRYGNGRPLTRPVCERCMPVAKLHAATPSTSPTADAAEWRGIADELARALEHEIVVGGGSRDGSIAAGALARYASAKGCP